MVGWGVYSWTQSLSPTEFVLDNSLHIHIHQTFREGVTLILIQAAGQVTAPPGRMTSAAARSLPELLVHSPGVREGIPLLGGSIVRRSEQPLTSRGLRRHPRAHARTEVPRWHARAARRREATHPSLSVAAATLQPAWPASNFGLGCPLDESRPTTSPGTGSR